MTEQSKPGKPTSAEFATVVQGQAELRSDFRQMAAEHRADMSKITEAQIDLSEKFATWIERSTHMGGAIDELKHDIHGENGIAKQVRDLQKDQEGDRTRWQILGAGVLAFIGLAGVVVTIVLWALDKYLG